MSDLSKAPKGALPAGQVAKQLYLQLQIAEEALRSIAANTCCDQCREAALVAQAALDVLRSKP